MNVVRTYLNRKTVLLLLSFLLTGSVLITGGHITVYMIGDSTMADKPVADNPERGWGQVFPALFDTSVTIENHAKNGRSTRSFIAENRWQTVLDKLKPGDYVFIQFGHNDEKKESAERYTSPEDYRKSLIKFVEETRAVKAKPVLCTPIVRRRFDKDGKFYDEHGVYPGVVREVAETCNVPLVDMHRKSEKLVAGAGPEDSKKIYLWIGPGEYKSLPEGKQDNTHFSEYGAALMASLAAEGIRELKLDLAGRLKK